mmetsp:Transcript_10908/g.20524  ORF Transcript_10908/g.20524 Transcript_10908/m.20524 type:complete len:261 (-) Transcript_10908:1019-1801(-)
MQNAPSAANSGLPMGEYGAVPMRYWAPVVLMLASATLPHSVACELFVSTLSSHPRKDTIGGVTSMVNVTEAGVGSTHPPAVIARACSVCVPSGKPRSPNRGKCLPLVHAPELSEYSYANESGAELSTTAAMLNTAVVDGITEPSAALATARSVLMGSTVKASVAAVPTLPTGSIAITLKVCVVPAQLSTLNVPVGKLCVVAVGAVTTTPPSTWYLKKELVSDDVYLKVPLVEVTTSVSDHVCVSVATGSCVSTVHVNVFL